MVASLLEYISSWTLWVHFQQNNINEYYIYAFSVQQKALKLCYKCPFSSSSCCCCLLHARTRIVIIIIITIININNNNNNNNNNNRITESKCVSISTITSTSNRMKLIVHETRNLCLVHQEASAGLLHGAGRGRAGRMCSECVNVE